MFKAILVNKDDQGYRAELAQVDESSLPEGCLLYTSPSPRD